MTVHTNASESRVVTRSSAPGDAQTSLMLQLDAVEKAFTLHLHRDPDTNVPLRLPVLSEVGLSVHAGECVALVGPSGAGKSSILKMIFGTYRVSSGGAWVRDRDGWINVAHADPRAIGRLRLHRLGYVSQFLRAIPRVSTLDVVSEPARARGVSGELANARAKTLLAQLNIPASMWHLPPATFSGGEQQRVNIARGLCADHPILLLDEPTASLDPVNRAAAISLIEQARHRGSAILGIFHDEATRAVADRTYQVESKVATTPATVASGESPEESSR